MDYKMQELLALVKDLADRYTGKASTSITYETAQQLMGAVLYCIQENDSEEGMNGTELSGQNQFSTAREAYEAGNELVKAKVRKANELYSEMILDFNDYGNVAYHDTVVKGIPEFFRWYDPVLDPQNNIILMDYMVLKPLQEKKGVDVIYSYLRCIWLEQKFLRQFPESYVREVLIAYEPDYEFLFINPCGVLLRKVLLSMLIATNPSKTKLAPADYEKAEAYIKQRTKEALAADLSRQLELLVLNIYEDDKELLQYLRNIISDFAAELQNAASNHTLNHVI